MQVYLLVFRTNIRKNATTLKVLQRLSPFPLFSRYFCHTESHQVVLLYRPHPSKFLKYILRVSVKP
jgi:hypothetical protein